MPRNVRNFWLDGRIDGRASGIDGGPQAKDGGFSLTIAQRDKGSITYPVRISGRVLSDGRICLNVDGPDGQGFQVITER